LLANCEDVKVRDPGRAVDLARKAVDAAPNDGGARNALGLAYYRTADWQASLASFDKAMALRNGGDGSDWCFVAMAHWQLGHHEEARQWYDRAVEWINQHEPWNYELSRLRVEAAALMGVNKKR
jgi:uncharacterized protein HemY